MDLVFEIGCEELPASFQKPAAEFIGVNIVFELEQFRLRKGTSSRWFATPRRLAVIVTGILERAPDVKKIIEGPPANVAFVDGKPTRAAEGFARKAGATLDSLRIENGRVQAEVEIKGLSATEIVPA